jgi:hypothetical protein
VDGECVVMWRLDFSCARTLFRVGLFNLKIYQKNLGLSVTGYGLFHVTLTEPLSQRVMARHPSFFLLVFFSFHYY